MPRTRAIKVSLPPISSDVVPQGRLWLVLSLCWVVAVGVVACRDEAWIGTRTSACAEAKGIQLGIFQHVQQLVIVL